VEEHSLHGGLGSLVSDIIAGEQLPVRIMRLGLKKGEFSKAGPRAEIRAYYRIDQTGIVNSVEKLIGGLNMVRKVEDEQAPAL